MKVVDDAQAGQSDRRGGPDDDGGRPRPSSSSLSVGGTDEAKVKQLIGLIPEFIYPTVTFVLAVQASA